MSFLDSLENNLKALEAMEPGGLDDHKRRDAERKDAIASAPWADRLKHGPFVKSLMGDLTRAGFSQRIKVNFLWIGTTLRLEAMEQRVELQPTPNGVYAVFPNHRVPLDLDGKPDSLVTSYMEILHRRKQENDDARMKMESDEEDAE